MRAEAPELLVTVSVAIGSGAERLCSGVASLSALVWRNRFRGNVRPVDRGKRLRDLRAGDKVLFRGEVRKVVGIGVYG